ncbi:MAG: type I DNA topoisomerase [Ruminococcaceae bacterium]|nr:type I DNA topoisomerase [Oscillospiraceae bacterium]
MTQKSTNKKTLIIVESPAKASTIKKYLGSNYNVVASMGHLRDLPKSQLGIDIDNNFEPRYITIRGKGDLISKLKRDAKNSSKVLLAADPDREGEAISWHLASLLDIDNNSLCRITFNEITKTAVKNAITKPRTIDMDLVDSQQARRVLDRIVGYQISPLLWKKVKKGLSAGRVQSVVTKLIVDREREINAFNEEEYWTIDVKLANNKGKTPFIAKYYGLLGDKKANICNKAQATQIVDELKDAKYIATSVQKSEKLRSPAPPFTTSTLQQEASRKLGFTTKRTMLAAQQLYEGVTLKGVGSVGLITYMRTDSLRISTDAQKECRSYISTAYGNEYIPKTPRFYKTKKGAQDAHEAIRPTSMQFNPESIKDSLKPDLYKLYKLIWNRFLASQMSSAVLDTVRIDISANDKHALIATGSITKFDGFTAVYVEGKDIEEEKEGKIPSVSEGEQLSFKDIDSKQHFTQPPLRYTEASLVKAMEEYGIGRPSTYNPTITTITSRGYVAREGKSLYPTELGTIVTDLMADYFKNIVDVGFTADMEDKLDTVEDGNTKWVDIINEFYTPFKTTLSEAEEKIGNIEIADEESDIPCDKCGRMMVYKQGRFGKFLACPGYPECKNTKSLTPELNVPCPNCGSKVQVRKSKKGATYYTCEKGTDCFISWDEPTNDKCPDCGNILMKRRPFRGRGPIKLVCFNEDCKYELTPSKVKK